VRPRVILVAAVAFLAVAGTVLVTTALAGGVTRDAARVLTNWTAGPMTPGKDDRQPQSRAQRDRPAEVTVEIEGFLAWAALDRTNREVAASPNATETSSTESMIKVWIVADYLRRLAAQGQRPSDDSLRDAQLAIRDSHNGAAERLYAAGGRDAVVHRLIEICGLTETHIPVGGSGWWSRTQMSARDAVRMGECIADGTAAGAEWTDWLLTEMRQVRGSTADRDQRPDRGFEGGRWGIIDGLPAVVRDQGVAIKNGWTRIGATGSWHLNCLAIHPDWVMAVMMRYPAEYSLDYGAERCASVAAQLVGERLAPTGRPE